MADDDAGFLASDPGPQASPPVSDSGTLQSDPSTGVYVGSDKPETAAPRAQPVGPNDKGNYALDSAQKRYQAAKAREDEADRQLQDQYQQIRALMARTQQPLPPTPQLQQVQTVQPTPTQQQSIGNILGNVAAMVAIGTAIFGKHRGGWGSAITQAGVGSFLQNFAQGRQEQSKEQYRIWKEAQTTIQENNKAKVQDYKDVVNDHRLDLAEQHQQLADLSYLRQDWRMYDAATRNAHAEVIKIMDQQQKALQARQTSSQKAMDEINKTLLKKQEAEQAKGEKVTSLPTFNVPKAKQMPIGTEFRSPDGTHYKIKSQDPFQVDKVAD